MHRLDWNDLQFTLAVACAGSLTGAARSLGVNHTTVLRRISALEEALGVRLFDRSPSGYVPTPAGEELAEVARVMQERVDSVERRVAGLDQRPTGTVRLTTTDTLVASVLPGVLAGFRAAQPGIQIELSTSNDLIDLGRREADIALRPAKSPPEQLVGRRIASVAFAVYAARSALGSRPTARDLADHRWLAPDDRLSNTSVARWLKVALPQVVPVLRADSLVTLCNAAAAGLGVAALPCYLGDRDERLSRLTEPVPEMTTELWLLTHDDLKQAARIQAVVGALAAALGEERALFEGLRGRGSWPMLMSPALCPG